MEDIVISLDNNLPAWATWAKVKRHSSNESMRTKQVPNDSLLRTFCVPALEASLALPVWKKSLDLGGPTPSDIAA